MKLGSSDRWRRLARPVPFVLAAALSIGALSLAHAPVVLARTHSQSDQSKKNEPPPKTRLRIKVTDPYGKPVGQASVYVRFNESGGLFHKDKLAELDLKTNDDGSTKVPPIPQGKIMIQVIAKGWRTFGQWYDIETAEETVQIKLKQPPHWY